MVVIQYPCATNIITMALLPFLFLGVFRDAVLLKRAKMFDSQEEIESILIKAITYSDENLLKQTLKMVLKQ